MRQIVKLLFVLVLVLLASCSTQQRVVYRDCDCNTTQFNLGWNNNQFWGWNNSPFFGWNVNPYWGWNDPFWGLNGWNRRYNGFVPRIQPSQPSRYERRQSIGSRLPYVNSVTAKMSWRWIHTNGICCSRNTTRNSKIGSRPSRIQQNGPVMNDRRTSSPQIQRNSQPTRIDNVYPQQTRPSRVQTQPSRVQDNTLNRVQSPPRIQQRQNTPTTTQPTRSRVQNREN